MCTLWRNFNRTARNKNGSTQSYDYYGSCQGCTSVIGEAVVVVLDISSSMKALMGDGSRFTVARDSLLEFIGDFRDYDYFGLILFDGNTHIAMDLAKIENKEQFLKETEYNLNHLYYAYYLDKDGNETDIVVNQNDGDKYTSQGYTIPKYGNVGYGGYDSFNGNAIKSYGTNYYNAIDEACQMYNSFEAEAISKKVIFISDGEPSDKGSGYVDIVESMAQDDIVTTSIGLATDNTSAITEMTLIAEAGKGVYRHSNDKKDLLIQLYVTYRKAELDDKVGKVDDFVFVEYDGEYYLTAYEGNKKEITNDGYVFYSDPLTNIFLIGYLGDETELVLPEAGPNGGDYYIEYCAFAKTNIKSIEIKSGVITVNDYAFTSDKLEKITFSQTKAITFNSSMFYP